MGSFPEEYYRFGDLTFFRVSTFATGMGQLDAARGSINFRRKSDSQEHPEAEFFVEFPAGPLSIGADIAIQPVEHVIGKIAVKLLSPTDSCRDRLAAFYHWRDRQSLETAVRIARYHKVELEAIREWSSREGASAAFGEFEQAVRRQKKARQLAKGAGRSRKRPRRG